ncbi:MAG: hypothetical protein ABI851_06080 [Saprospiraceae bacterium]
MKIIRLNKFFSAAFFCLAICQGPNLFSQIKVGDNPKVINANSALEIESINKGLLLPRLTLNSTSNAAPLNSFVQGMFVFNTSTINDITPGIYYSDGVKWIRVNSDAGMWNLAGNSGTDSTNNFLGTTDKVPLILKTNNVERLRITENGRVGIGTSKPTVALQVNGELVIDTLTAGNITTDNILVANPTDGKVKIVSSSNFILGVLSRTEIVLNVGQTIFNTPTIITDINKILLFRNGVLISFIKNNSNSIVSEIQNLPGDEIKIIQLK